MNHAKELAEALEGLVRINEQHNEEISKIIGRPIGWKDDYLNKARDTLARYRAAIAEQEAEAMTLVTGEWYEAVGGKARDDGLWAFHRDGRTRCLFDLTDDNGNTYTREGFRKRCRECGITLKEAGAL